MSINVGLFIAWSLQFQYNSSIIGSFSEFFGGRLFLFNCSQTVFVNWKKEINTGFKTSKETLTFSFFSYVVSVIKLGGCLVKAEVLRQCSCSLWSFDHKAVKSKKTKMQINWSLQQHEKCDKTKGMFTCENSLRREETLHVNKIHVSFFTGEKCLRMRRDINHVVDFRQSH